MAAAVLLNLFMGRGVTQHVAAQHRGQRGERGDAGTQRFHLGEGTGKVRGRYGEGTGKVRGRYGEGTGKVHQRCHPESQPAVGRVHRRDGAVDAVDVSLDAQAEVGLARVCADRLCPSERLREECVER